MPGPAPKPTKLKLLEGNPGRRPLNTSEPQPEIGAPTQPEWLLPEGKREWARIVPELVRLGLLAKIDRASLAAYCQCWAMYVAAIKDIEANGTTFKTDTGYEGPRPSVGVAVKMLEKLSTFAAKFGLTPSDRSRIHVDKPAEVDPFAEFLQQSGQMKAANE